LAKKLEIIPNKRFQY